jgi:hypothetical protein
LATKDYAYFLRGSRLGQICGFAVSLVLVLEIFHWLLPTGSLLNYCFPPFQKFQSGAHYAHLGAEYFSIATAVSEGRGFSSPFKVPSGSTAWMPPGLVVVEATLLWMVQGNLNGVVAAVLVMMAFAYYFVFSRLAHFFGRGNWICVLFALVASFGNYTELFLWTHDGWVLMVLMTLLILESHVALNPLITAFRWGLLGAICGYFSPAMLFAWIVVGLLRF